jgi:hypothetical protein
MRFRGGSGLSHRFDEQLDAHLRWKLGVCCFEFLKHTMSGSASRSQFSRFVKRRLMLLILKLAIFIGSDGSDRRSEKNLLSSIETCPPSRQRPNLTRSVVTV